MITLTPVAADDCTEDAMIVFDGSGSMAETGFNQLDQPRILEARAAVRRVMPNVAPHRRIGLVTYGPGTGKNCQNINLVFRPMPNSAEPIINAIDAMEPSGSTPLADSVSLAAQVLDYRNQPGEIVLVTDGKETCLGLPCELALHFATDAADLTVHVIGYKVRGASFRWQSEGETDYTKATTVARCLADMTGGQYVSAESTGELEAALNETLGCPVIGSISPLRRLGRL